MLLKGRPEAASGSPAVFGGHPCTPPTCLGCCGCAELPAGKGWPRPRSSLSLEHWNQTEWSPELREHSARGREGQPFQEAGLEVWAHSPDLGNCLPSAPAPPTRPTRPLPCQHALTFLHDRHQALMGVLRASSGGQGRHSELWLPPQPHGAGRCLLQGA